MNPMMAVLANMMRQRGQQQGMGGGGGGMHPFMAQMLQRLRPKLGVPVGAPTGGPGGEFGFSPDQNSLGGPGGGGFGMPGPGFMRYLQTMQGRPQPQPVSHDYQTFLQDAQERRDARAGVPGVPPQGAASPSAQRRTQPGRQGGARSF